MLKAVIIDTSAVARGLLNTVLLDGGYDVVGQTHTCASGLALLIKHNPHIVCIAREQIENGEEVVREIKTGWPKTLIFMVSSEFDAATIQAAHAMGVNGFIVKPFKADTVLNTIRNTVIAMVKRQRAALAKDAGAPEGQEGLDGGGEAAAE
ncbi:MULTISPECIES: response regulator [unclassified Duganella]|uniref:response regulator n=1 Tax=unclassified Duganella TaxID=2636909 RepID=UPI000E348275|nr:MULTISPECIES: response regulator [unclassified Duganella]RFP11254.1 response regulator [Duganella sp. BJB475]RFP29573.1 response regulator [Duganella sp. BJB476]